MTTGKTTRKSRSDSASAAIEAAKNAALPDLQPPAHVVLSSGAEPYFRDIVRARARDEWNDFQLTVAAQMAECMAEQVEEAGHLALEGKVVMNAKGTQVANPRVSILEQLARRQMALARSLQMIGRAVGDPRAPTNKRKLENSARAARDEALEEEDDLLA